MHLILAGIGAVVVGAGDFAGGAATRRDRPLRVTTLAFVVGGVLLLAVVPLFEGSPTTTDLGWGAASGIAGGLGVVTLYRGFQRAAMGLVAPIAAVITAVIPVLGGIAAGERPSALVFGGFGVGIAAIALISTGPTGSGRSSATRWTAINHGLVTGLGFGGLLLALTFISDDAGLMPLVWGRASSFAVVFSLALVMGGAPIPEAGTARLIAALSGVLATAGNTLYYLGLSVGPVVSTTVVYSMFPASTVILAWLVYKERLRPSQLAGVALALGAVALLVAG